MITESTHRTTTLSEPVQGTMLKKVAEDTGMMEQGEIVSSLQNAYVLSIAVQSLQVTKLKLSPSLIETEVEEADIITDTLVRMIHTICLLLHLTYMRTK